MPVYRYGMIGSGSVTFWTFEAIMKECPHGMTAWQCESSTFCTGKYICKHQDRDQADEEWLGTESRACMGYEINEMFRKFKDNDL